MRIPQPPGGTAVDLDQALAITDDIGFPVLVRPSYVLGGRAMQIVYDRNHLARAMDELAGFGSLGKEGGLSAERPVLIDRFLDDATEVDVDAIRDHTGEVLIGGVMEHVEEAGVHSGDSACAIPPPTLPSWVVEVIESYTAVIAKRARRSWPDQRAVRRDRHDGVRDRGQPPGEPDGAVRGQGDRRAARQGRHPGDARRHAGRAARRGSAAATGRRPRRREGGRAAVQPVPRGRPGARPGDALDRRGHGHRRHVRPGVLQGQVAAGTFLPTEGTVFLSLADRDKPAGLVVAQRFRALGLGIVATEGTAAYLAAFDAPVDQVVAKVQEAGPDGGEGGKDARVGSPPSI